MDYMTLKEAAEKWGVTPRRVNYYCAGGRIPGAVKMAGVWLLPKTAEKPLDGRTKQGKELKMQRILYLQRQHKAFGNAENTIRQFLDGNTTSRIECSQAGDWYSLFHAINEMATILSAHAENQRQTKEFLQDIISDVSHQIKTPLSALKMYHEIIESHKDDTATVSSFTEKSQREIKRMEDTFYAV